MKKTILLFTLSLLLTGCGLMYRPNIQQGNIITPDAVAQLRPGLTQDQVRYIMGTPVLINPYYPNRWEYVYTYQPNGKLRQQQHVTVIFAKGVLQSVETTPLQTVPGSYAF